MINAIRLKFWRKFEEMSVEFGLGLQFLKGANEAGKSSLFEAISYNWFGSKALEVPVDRVITYKHEKKEMKTETDFTVRGKMYTCKRSASGAEVTCEGEVKCTGQKDVTAYIEDLFGIPSGTAHLLLVSRQNDIRGILENGKAHEFIEKLADFSEIDDLVDSIQNKLGTGAVGPAKMAVENAQAKFSDLTKPVKPKQPDTSETAAYIVRLERDRDTAVKTIDKLNPELEKIETKNQNLLIIAGRIGTKSQAIASFNNELESITVSSIDEKKIGVIERKIQVIEKAENHHEAWLTFNNLPAYPEDFWEGNTTSFKKEISDTAAKQADAQEETKELLTKIRVEQSKIIKDATCPTCKQEVKHRDKVNSEINKEIEDLEAALIKQQTVYHDSNEMLQVLSNIEDTESIYAAFLIDYSCYVNVDHEIVPTKITWIGEAPVKPDANLRIELLTKLDELILNKRLAEKNVKRQTEINDNLSKLKLELAELEKQSEKVKDTTALKAEITSLLDQKTEIVEKITDSKTSITNITNEYDKKVIAYDGDVKAYDTAALLVKDSKKEFKTLEENNALLKAVRAARIEVTDHIWNLVLQSISNYFNDLRGSVSVVSKDVNGFVCDGEPAIDLSGSTKDILGLAIRFALTGMFLPGVGLQLLDEPGAGCDADRSMIMMGFIAASGFDQTIIVTHRVDDEVAADNLICI